MSVIVTGRVFWTQFENIQYTDKSGKVVKIGKPSAKLVMLAIADSADDWGENSWQSFETIAAKSSVERRSVMRVVRGLILSKYLSIGGVSRYGTNDYKINLSLLGNPPARRAKNGRPKTTGDSIAETGDSIAETGDSIAETGYSIAETGDSIAETGDSIAETGDSIAETGDRTSPYPSLTHPNPSPQKTKIEKRGDLVQGLVDMSQAPGIKRAIRIDNLESLIKVKTSINPTGIKWKTFLQFVDDQQQKENKSLIVFLNWMMDQPNYNPLYWSADRMRQYWDMAFIEEPAPPQYTPPPSTGPAMSREQYQAELARRQQVSA